MVNIIIKRTREDKKKKKKEIVLSKVGSCVQLDFCLSSESFISSTVAASRA